MSPATAAVIGIDPGAHSAAALVSIAPAPAILSIIEHTFAAKRHAYNTPSAIIAALLADAAAQGLTVAGAWLEGQFVGPNVASALSLARSAGRWQEACAVSGLPCTIVESSAWQARELREWRTIGTTKRAAILRCAGIWRVAVSEHAADAALIARYAAIETWAHARQPRIL